MQRKLFNIMLSIILLLSAASFSACAGTGAAPDGEESTAVVALAWNRYMQGGLNKRMIDVLEVMDVDYVLLDQVVYAGAPYDAPANEQTRWLSAACTEETGMLKEAYGQKLRTDWMHSNVAEVIAAHDFDLVMFPGGEDICPSLQMVPDVERNAGEAYNATRDISDYILMRYCLENDIPVLAICRGMQMLGVASGCSIIQNIPAYYAERGETDPGYHRMPEGTEGRDFVPHDVDILDRNSLLYAIVQTDTIPNAPSWHHQALESVEGAALKVTASTTREGIEIIEAIERTDRTFALGVQFHPEASILKAIDQEENIDEYTSKDECIAFFRKLIDYVMALQEAAEAS